jgi:hypothetical protein
MKENRDPVICPDCGTVNPWMNDDCRSCGISLEGVEPGVPTLSEVELPTNVAAASESSSGIQTNTDARKQGRETKRLNALWIVIGLLLYLIAMSLGEKAILIWIISPDPELKTLVEELSARASAGEEFNEEELEQRRDVFLSKTELLVFIVLLGLGAPLFIGLIIGMFSGGVREGAIAMGLSVFVVLVLAGQFYPALLAGPINAGLGAAGAWGGCLLRRRKL